MAKLGTVKVPAVDNENLLGVTPVLIIKLPGFEFSNPTSQDKEPLLYRVCAPALFKKVVVN